MNSVTKATIHAFRNRTLSDYGEGQYVLAWHAAFPVGFTPDMLYQLWANFRHDPGGRYPAIPMIAVNDLLMSALCRPVGNDIYEMEADIRSFLLEELRSHLPDRLIELAFFLENYANYQLTDTRYRQFRETLLINAGATSNPAKALKAISVKLQEALAQNDKAEVMRLRELLEVFARHEKGGDHMSESVFYPWLQYTVALKGGYLNAPESMVQQKLNDIDSVTGKSLKFYAEKPGEGAISIPLPESLFRKNVVREITVEEETSTEERPPALHAILTGIDQYEQLPSLAGCENDMNLWKNYLEKKFGNSGRDVKISLLRNNSATSRGILQRFRAEVLKARPGDFIFFAFSGHASHERVAMIHAFDTFWAEGGMQNVLTEEDFLPFIEKNSHINFVFLLDGEGLDAFFSEPRENLILLSGLSKGETSFELKIDGESYGIFTSTAIRALGMLQDLSYWNFIDLTRRMIAEADGTQTPQIQCTPGNEFKTFLQDHLVSDLSEAEERIRICREKGLNKLDLTGLGLTRLPEGIGSLTQLETIDLFDNFLTSLPGEIGELKDLKALLASKNRIGSLPASLQNLEQLETIKLDGNRLETFPEVLLNMRGLQYISLEDNFIDVVPKRVADLPNLRSFDVRNNPVFNIPKGKKKFTRGALQSLFAQMDPERDGPMQIAVLGSWDECETIRKSLHEVIDGRRLDVIYLEGSPVEWYQQVTPMAHNMIALHIEYDKDNEKLSEFLNFDEVDRKKLSLAQLRNLMSHPGPARFCFLNYDNSEKDQEEMLDGWGFDQCICYKGTPRTQLNVSSFIASFYRHLADGNTVQEAHKKATEDVVNQLRNTSAAEGIVCASREGADLSWKLSGNKEEIDESDLKDVIFDFLTKAFREQVEVFLKVYFQSESEKTGSYPYLLYGEDRTAQSYLVECFDYQAPLEDKRVRYHLTIDPSDEQQDLVRSLSRVFGLEEPGFERLSQYIREIKEEEVWFQFDIDITEEENFDRIYKYLSMWEGQARKLFSDVRQKAFFFFVVSTQSTLYEPVMSLFNSLFKNGTVSPPVQPVSMEQVRYWMEEMEWEPAIKREVEELFMAKLGKQKREFSFEEVISLLKEINRLFDSGGRSQYTQGRTV